MSHHSQNITENIKVPQNIWFQTESYYVAQVALSL